MSEIAHTVLGRDEQFIEKSCKYAEAVFGASAMISVFPGWIRRIVGPLIAMPAQHYLSACTKILIPYVELRLEKTRAGENKEVRTVFSKISSRLSSNRSL
jgi:hypothetical protein